MRNHLLPAASQTATKTVSEILDRDETLAPPIEAARSAKLVERPDTYLPWLEIEYGLGDISRFFVDKREMLDTGIAWQRKRGTPQAVRDAIAWIGYTNPVLYDQVLRRRMWQRYQVETNLVPTIENPLLYDAEYLAGISDPARSVFYRGFETYDVRPVEWSFKRWSNSMWSDSSGVRMPGGSTKWSHGVNYAFTHEASLAEKEALGVDNIALGDIAWEDWDHPWLAEGVTWGGVVDVPLFKFFVMSIMPVYVGFYDGLGAPIGYRKATVAKDVTDQYTPEGDEIYVEYQCRTGFGDGFGSTAATAALVFRGKNSDATKPGKLWLTPQEFAVEAGYDLSDMKVGAKAFPVAFRRTVREHVTFTLEI